MHFVARHRSVVQTTSAVCATGVFPRFGFRPLLLGSTVAISMATMACGPGGPEAAAAASVRPAYDKTGKLTHLEYDADGDGRIDTWGYMDGARVVRVETDENGDGKVDRWEYHSQQSAVDGRQSQPPVGGPQSTVGRQSTAGGPQMTVERVERATRFDGKVSRWEYFDRGTLSRVEEDTDGDGTVDKWETYADGTLSMMALDHARRGRPDRRLLYKADGTLDRIEVDTDGSGNFHPLPPSQTP